MALHAYADESGTHDEKGLHPGAEAAVVAGYFAEQDQWAEFCRLWRKALRDEGIEVFHASDLLGPTGLCKDPEWSRERIDAFVRRLIEIARENTYFAVGGLLVVRDYQSVVPGWLREKIGHPYYFSLQLFLGKMLKVVNEDLEEPLRPSEQIGVFFDQHDQFEPIAQGVYRQYQARRDPHGRLGVTGFFLKETDLPHQAADLLAYRLRKIQTRKLLGQRAISPGGWDDDMIEHRNIITAVYDDESLRKIVDLATQGRG